MHCVVLYKVDPGEPRAARLAEILSLVTKRSGVSRSSGIPTGWGIVMDLIGKVAKR